MRYLDSDLFLGADVTAGHKKPCRNSQTAYHYV
jgi:hypothetical protein